MQLDFKRLIQTETGRIVISVILGLGLATLFRKICTDGNCIDFHGTVVGDFDEKVYKHDDKCYKYKADAAKCNTEVKKVLDVYNPMGLEGFQTD